MAFYEKGSAGDRGPCPGCACSRGGFAGAGGSDREDGGELWRALGPLLGAVGLGVGGYVLRPGGASLGGA
ncbi:MAG TPA: hypothetical protein PK393_11895, partial [Synergistaceae bacterium]|nr:hypothetical protein [Synergistaceae bacterium]